MMRFASLLAAALLATSAAHAQSLKTSEVLSSIAARPLSEPNPVLGGDGRMHLAFELLVSNPTALFVTLDKVEVTDGGSQVLFTREGDALGAMTQPYGFKGRTLPPGGTAVVLIDSTLPGAAAVSSHVTPRISATRQMAGPDNKPVPMAADAPLPPNYTFTLAPVAVSKPAVVIAPPLRGPGWVAVNGCCDAITPHRGAMIPVNGQLRVPERFAIDWIKLDAGGRVFTGDAAKLASYAYYGTTIHAVADGTVVNLYDSTDEQVPGAPAKGVTPANVGGNMVVVDIGGGAFAFYAHMQRGSLKVKLGDRVKTGDVIGLLGNTGNSTAPHLHFHVMDSPSPLDANGLPFVFTRFTSRGVLAAGADDVLEKGGIATIELRWTGALTNALPLNNQVVDFD